MKAIARLKDWLFNPPHDGPAAAILLRLMAGGVFVSEGILKFAYASLGVGRFSLLGFPMPRLTASVIGAWEILGGALVMVGLLTRGVAILFAIEMVVAVLSTKIGLYLGTSPLPLPSAPPQVGLWAVLHESRSDWAQLLTSLYLVIAGPGLLSLDARLQGARARAAGGQSHPGLSEPLAEPSNAPPITPPPS
jgi:uncharacterized membrane protein YphA (DoxX/SURF4 family)